MQSSLIAHYKEVLEVDPLYAAAIKGTNLEAKFWDEEYLAGLEEKRWYSTVEIAEWFGINDAQLRYYIKPFHEYLFTDDTPSSSSAYRLNAEAVIKLRMITVLKDEYKVKGLQRLIGLGEGYIQRKPSKGEAMVPSDSNSVENKVANLTVMVEQILKTGIFEITHGEEGSQINIKDEFINERLKRITGEDSNTAAIAKIQEVSSKIEKENANLKEEIQKLRENKKEDIAIRMKERMIQMELVAELRSEASEKWHTQNKASVFEKLFRSDKLEAEKEKFISEYTKEHLNERYNNAMKIYHNSME